MSVRSQNFYLINVLSDAFWEDDMIVVNQYIWAMFFFYIIEKVIMYENDCGKSIYINDAFPLYHDILII